MNETYSQPIRGISRKAALGGIALALYWGCALLTAAHDAQQISAGYIFDPMAGFIGLVCALAIFGAIPHLVASRVGSAAVRLILLFGPIFSGSASILFPDPYGVALVVTCIARLFLGISLGFMLAHLGTFLAICDEAQGALIGSAAFLCGAALFILCSKFIWVVGDLTIAIIALVGSISFILAKFDEHGKVNRIRYAFGTRTGRRDALHLPKGFWTLFIGLFLYSIVYGITVPLTLDLGRGQAHSTPIELVLLVPGIIFIILSLRFRDKLDFRRFQWCLFAPSAVALLAIPFASEHVALLCCAILIMVFSFFDLASFILLVNLARSNEAALTMRIFSWGRLANFIGMAIGMAGASAILGEGFDQQGTPITIAAFVAVVILVWLMTFFGNSSIAPRKTTCAPVPEGQAQTELDGFDTRCAAIAQANKLSAREAELFAMIARGRSASYIADKLCLSPSTVKTHTYRIYRKLEVHSRQELIDLVEGGS